MSGPMETRIHQKLVEAFEPVYLELENESHMHSVPKGSETHFRAFVVSLKFVGQSRVTRSRSIHDILANELKAGVHALSLRALTPAEFEAQGGVSNMQSPPCLGGSKHDK